MNIVTAPIDKARKFLERNKDLDGAYWVKEGSPTVRGETAYNVYIANTSKYSGYRSASFNTEAEALTHVKDIQARLLEIKLDKSNKI